jgi:hypothetical protein
MKPTTGLSYEKFLEIRTDLTADLAEAFARKIKDMGESVQGIAWFSSSADKYAIQSTPKAA